jgi:glutathione synthase/RimK-type ligase-like ATP-grasp enzyme
MEFDIVLLTEQRYENPSNPTPYQQQVMREDAYLQAALERQGLRVARVDWARTDFDWARAGTAVFRTTWDYFKRIDEFTAWLDDTAAKIKMINPAATVRWNMDKHYLLDLARSGVPIVDTVFFEIGQKADLSQFFAHFDVESLVLKPCIAAGSLHTYHFGMNKIEEIQAIFDDLISVRSMMLQAFQKNVLRYGEISLVMIGGEITHSIIKRAKSGDFRVQQEFGGSVEIYSPSSKEIELAHQTYEACSETPLYGRVDILLNNQDKPVISELELIEPELFFRLHEAAAQQFAKSLSQAVR